jgi:putative ABC transport system permease protein
MPSLRTRIRSILGYVASWFRTADRDARLNEEIEFHLDMAAERHERTGLSATDATRVAAVRFGGRQQWREASRDEFRSRLLADLSQDLRYAVRAAKSAPAFTISAILTLALGIGANTAIFSAVDGVMLKGLPFSHEERLVRLYENNQKKGIHQEAVAPGNFNDWHARTAAFSAIATAEPFGFSLRGPEGTEEIRNYNVTRDFFAVLDAKPLLGRLLQAEDFVPGPPQAIVLTYASWQKRFGADPAVVGKRITINGAQTTIVGVLPREFSYLEIQMPQEFFAPKVLDSTEVSLRTSGWYNAVGRLKPGVSISRATADLNRIATQLAAEHPRSNADRGVTVIPLRDGIISKSSRALGLSLAAVGLVLLIACGNVANLTLARMNRRSREFALRAAIGASKWRVARQVLTESLLIATLGGAAGVAFAYWGVSVIRAASPASIPRIDEIAVDDRTLVFALITVVVTALLFGVAPALRAAELDAGDELKAGGRSAGDKRQTRVRDTLVSGQVAFAIVLLVSAGLLVRSFVSLVTTERGYRSDHVLTALMFSWGHAPTPSARRAFVNELVRRSAALPGVVAAGATSSPPLAGSVGIDRTAVAVEGHPQPPGQAPQVHVTSTTPGAIDALRMSIIRGRSLRNEDDSASAPVVLINETMARMYWPGENPLGRRLRIGFYGAPITREVVGIVLDTKQTALESPPEPTVYLPHAQAPTGGIWLVIRTAMEPSALTRDVKRIVGELAPNVPIAGTPALEEIEAESLKPRRFTLLLFVSFAAAALLLAMVGVYGVLSQATAERAREFGVRIALGARQGDIIRLVMRQGLASAAIGIALGLVGAVAVTRLLREMLYSVTPFDLVAFGSASGVMLLTALAACYVPARHATRADPLESLREG